MRKSHGIWMAAAAMGAAWYFAFAVGEATGETSTGPDQAAFVAMEKTGRPLQAPGKGVVLEPAPLEGRGLYDGLYAANDLKAYYEAMKSKPEQGGYFYADAAITSCRQKMSLLAFPESRFSTDEAIADRQRGMLKTFKKLCGGFTELDIQDSYGGLQAEGQRRGDPLVSARTQMINASTWQGFEKALGTVFAARDAYLAATVWPYFSRIGFFNGLPDAEHFFDAKDYSQGRDYAIYELAWQLVPCIHGAGCHAGNDTVIIAACLDFGVCVQTREELITAQFKGDASVYPQAFELAQRLSDAVWQGNYSAFMPRR